MIDISTIQPIIIAAIGSAAVAYYWYINNQIDPTKPTSPGYRIKAVLPTVIVGALIGALSVLFGIEPLTDANVVVQMGQYGLITSVVDTGLKTISRYFEARESGEE
jgi:energy-converting hydrogenase Eha subunit A